MNYKSLKKLFCLALAGGTMIFGGGSEAAVVTDKAPILTYADHTVPTYDKAGGKRVGFITANISLVQVKSVRSDGWAYGSYAIAGGKRVNRWFQMAELQGYANFQNYTLTIDNDRIVYRTSAAASRLGSVLVNAKATVIGEEGNYFKIIYRVNGGSEWRMGWIEKNVAPKYDDTDNKPIDGNLPNGDDNKNNGGNIDDNKGDVEKFILDGSAMVDYPSGGDRHKVKISGWTNGTYVNVRIGMLNYEINIDNPNHEEITLEEEYTLSADMEGTTQTVYVDAGDWDDPGNTKRIAEKVISIPKGSTCGQLKGDVNGDGRVDESDVKLLEQYIVQLVDSLPCPKNADMNEDGRITLTDVARLEMLLKKDDNSGKVTPVHNPEFADISLSVHDYNCLHLSGKAFDRDDMSQNLEVRIDAGGHVTFIQANQGDHRFDVDMVVNIPEGTSVSYPVSLTAVNIGGGSDTFLNKGTVRIESPIVMANGIRLATGRDGIAAGAIVELKKENRATNQYFVSYNDGPLHWALGGHEGWVSKGAVDPYECWWGRTVTSSGYADVYTEPNTNSRWQTSANHWERVRNPGHDIALLITGQSGGFYRVRYHSYASEDNVVKDRWVLASEIGHI